MFISFAATNPYPVPPNNLPPIAPADRWLLDGAFKTANGLAYVLLGFKPACLTLLPLRALEVLKASINGDKFAVRAIPGNNPSGVLSVLVLNKALCQGVIEQNKSSFKRLYPERLVPDSKTLMRLLEAEPENLLLYDDLLGTLLGYGERNARLYEQMLKAKDNLGKLPPDSSLRNRYRTLEMLLGQVDIGTRSPFRDALTIAFRADPTSSETVGLLFHYQNAFQTTEGMLKQPYCVDYILRQAQ